MNNTPKLVVGLGNPGPEYDRTRHNVGFEVVEGLARDLGIAVNRRAFRAVTGEGVFSDTKVHLLKPHTYMNLSGDAVADFIRNKPIDSTGILVVTDDIHLPVGRLRIRSQGSAGGHNGLKSIISRLSTMDFARLRIGVGGPPDADRQIDFVLSRFAPEDRKQIDEAVARAIEAIKVWITDGIEPAMNRFNG